MTEKSFPGVRVFPAAPAARASGVRAPVGGERWVILFLFTFLLLFPKGGIKLGPVPITWGYLGLAAVALWLPLSLWFRRSAPVRRLRLSVLAALVPFQAIVWLTLLANGTNGLGFAISLLVTFFFIPVVFVLILGIHLDRLDLDYLFRLFRWGVPVVAAYGVFLFFYKLKTGSFIEIPYLTVNAGDYGNLEGKYIDRGGVFKLISTYNNGNIYGVCMLTLLPFYSWLERSRVRTGVVKLSLLLTLSRTVWLGLIFYEVMHRLYVRRLSARSVAAMGGALLVVFAGVWLALGLLEVNPAVFLLDRNLGGRIGQLSALETAGLVGDVRFEAILEMVYLSVLNNFGLLGLAAFLLAMTAPLAMHLLGVVPFSGTSYKKSLALGLATYLFVAMSDGALLFIPVMAFYWFIVSLLLSANDSFLERELEHAS